MVLGAIFERHNTDKTNLKIKNLEQDKYKDISFRTIPGQGKFLKGQIMKRKEYILDRTKSGQD